MAESEQTPESLPEAMGDARAAAAAAGAGEPGVEGQPDVAEPDAVAVADPASTTSPASDAGRAATDADRAARRARTRRAAVIGARAVTGLVGVVAAVAVVATVGLVPFPTIGVPSRAVTVQPAAAPVVLACPGAALRFGSTNGTAAGVAENVGSAALQSAASGGMAPTAAVVKTDDAQNGPTPSTLTAPAGADVAGAQSQQVAATGLAGFSATACAEATSSAWLVGGSTRVGRTTILSLVNPTAVDAIVTLEIWGEKGAISAPGLSGIQVAAGARRTLSLAGFAPGIVSPVVHVTARGGQVAATLQESIVRGLTASGVDQVPMGIAPATSAIIPGVRILGAADVAGAAGISDWDDVVPVVRVANPGTTTATVSVNVGAAAAGQAGTSFSLTIAPGAVVDARLDSGTAAESGASLGDGTYTVRLSSDQPVVGGVRASVTTPPGTVAPNTTPTGISSDLAWYAAAPALTGDTLFAVAPGPAPQLTAVNPGSTDATLTLAGAGVPDQQVAVPAGASVAVPLSAGTSYTATGAAGLSLAVSYADATRTAGYPVVSQRPVSGPVVIRP